MASNVNDGAELDSPKRTANFPWDFNLNHHRLQVSPLLPQPLLNYLVASRYSVLLV